MARAKETSSKKENAKRKSLKKVEKQNKKELRKSSSDKGKSLEEMLMYVDENGNLSSSPPGEKKATESKPERSESGTAPMRHTGILERF
ncbi:MAG: cold shock domain-containing protein, partial [Siphonobacter aquaeclarae]|nr:cold shock domain-containing protein [Siphonobacter aquaeclarae]